MTSLVLVLQYSIENHSREYLFTFGVPSFVVLFAVRGTIMTRKFKVMFSP